MDTLLHRAMQATEQSRRLRADFALARRAALSSRIAALGRVVAVMEKVAIARRLCEGRSPAK
jgi:hypothetical protein